MDGRVYVIFQFDVEDFITPETDDILLRLAQIMEGFGIKASFCIVGEKARVIEGRGRTDVIEALKRQDLAYQSNLHSVHPVIAEYLMDKGWDDGVEEVKRREAPGIEDLKRIFGVEPSAFIQPGGSWAPETPYAIKLMGVRVYADGIFQSEPVWFCGELCIRAAQHFPEHSRMEDLKELTSKFDEMYNSKMERGGGVITIVLHPCMFLTENFWDAINFAGGINTPPSEFIEPDKRSQLEVEESLETFERFVGHILDRPRVEALTFRELPSLYVKPDERIISLNEAFKLAEEASGRNDWYIIGEFSISPAEAVRLLVDLIVEHLSTGTEPRDIRVKFTLGPTSKPLGSPQPVKMELAELLELCRAAKAYMDSSGRVPPSLRVRGVNYGPGDILGAAANAVLHYSKYDNLPSSLKVHGLQPLPEVVHKWRLKDRVRAQWGWIIFPRSFRSKRIEEMTLWQSWTMRPAMPLGWKG